ncbi:PREDICTED: ataxin-7-like protein 1 [Polistes dominula]|uniref:Ataxin-7-like protein 1 n=1 Tax=Polistes dominula TaxID=743375 RepID=A0ABM1I0A0_POLDO|nr:PREDICTED: ataxin-7-like protein 1 [Polistes dominula]
MSGSDSPTFFHGQPWSNWIERIGRDKPLSDEESETKPASTVTRLSSEDIDLYGFCPERDTFYGVVCEICNAIVKPQALIQHMESRHPSSTANFPPPSVPVTKPTVKTPYCKVSKLKKTQPASAQNSSSTKVIHTSAKRNTSVEQQHQQQQQQQQQPSSTSTTSLPVSSSPRSPLETALQTVQTATTSTGNSSLASSSPVKSPGTSGTTRRKRLKADRSLLKDREYDPDRHCGVLNEETGKPCTRSLTCKAHTVSLRRTVIGRSKTFDKLLAEYRAAKEIPSNTRSSKLSVSGTVVPLPSPSVNPISLTTNASTSNVDSEAPSSPPVLSLPDTYPLPKAVDLLYRCLAPHGSTKPTKLEEEYGNEELRSLESSLVEGSASTSSSQTAAAQPSSSTSSMMMAPISVVLPSLSPLPANTEESSVATLIPTASPVPSAPPPTTTTSSGSTSTLQTTSLNSIIVSPMAVVSNDIPSPNSTATPTTVSTPITNSVTTLATTPITAITNPTTPSPSSTIISTSLKADNTFDVDLDDSIDSIYSTTFKDDKTASLRSSNNLLLSPLSRSSYRQFQQASSMSSLNLFEPIDQLEQRHNAGGPINGKRFNHGGNRSSPLGHTTTNTTTTTKPPNKRNKQDYHRQDYSTSIQLEATTTSTPYPNFGDITWSNCHPEPLAVSRWLRITSSRKHYNFNIQ